MQMDEGAEGGRCCEVREKRKRTRERGRGSIRVEVKLSGVLNCSSEQGEPLRQKKIKTPTPSQRICFIFFYPANPLYDLRTRVQRHIQSLFLTLRSEEMRRGCTHLLIHLRPSLRLTCLAHSGQTLTFSPFPFLSLLRITVTCMVYYPSVHLVTCNKLEKSAFT
jgi:hypothetical protein